MSEKMTKDWMEAIVSTAERVVSDFAKVLAATCKTKEEALDKCAEFIKRHLGLMKTENVEQTKAEHAAIVIQARTLYDALCSSKG